MKHSIALATSTVAMIVGTASAGLVTEVESNNTIATANDLGIFSQPGGSIAVDATLTDNDVDWFGFTINDTATLTFFAAFALSGSDGVMQIVSAGGDVIAFDDDSGVGLLPALQLENLAAGTYYIGFSGFGDAGASSVDSDELFDGIGHSENFAYKLSVGFTIVPAPGAFALLGMGGLVATRRRR